MHNQTSIARGHARAKALATAAMNQAAADIETGESDYDKARRRAAEAKVRMRAEGLRRHQEHNHALRVAAQIRRHGGHQDDLFLDNQTGLPMAA